MDCAGHHRLQMLPPVATVALLMRSASRALLRNPADARKCPAEEAPELRGRYGFDGGCEMLVACPSAQDDVNTLGNVTANDNAYALAA